MSPVNSWQHAPASNGEAKTDRNSIANNLTPKFNSKYLTQILNSKILCQINMENSQSELSSIFGLGWVCTNWRGWFKIPKFAIDNRVGLWGVTYCYSNYLHLKQLKRRNQNGIRLNFKQQIKTCENQ